MTNTGYSNEETARAYEKRGNCENYIKESKYDMNVGSLLLKSFWANEAVFQLMMLAYNLFLLFKFDKLVAQEYRQQIKTFPAEIPVRCRKNHQDGEKHDYEAGV